MTNRDALEEVMNAVLATGATAHRVEMLEAARVLCGPVYDYAQMLADPQVRHRGLVQYANDAEFGEVPYIRTCGCIMSPPSAVSTTSRSSAASA